MSESTEVKPKRPFRKAAIVVVVVGLIVLLFCGSFHVVWTGAGAPIVLRKEHFTLAESFVSLDAILSNPKGQPQRFPLTLAALARDGVIRPNPTYVGRKMSAEDIAEHQKKHPKDAQRKMLAHPIPRPPGWVAAKKGV